MALGILLVDTDRKWLEALRDGLAHVGIGQVELCTDFQCARRRLLASPPDVLVTNLRLGAYNGLHRVMLTNSAEKPMRCVTFGTQSNPTDVSLARDAQKAGAFFEPSYRLPHALPAYLRAALPSRDRRDPAREDRRFEFRGGRRVSDTVEIRPAVG
jgi:DNA-binding NtrC family response regulator